MHKLACLLALVALVAPLSAKDSLGVYSDWAAFSDGDAQNCYAIAKATNRDLGVAYATIATWPARNVRNQIHIKLSREAPASGRVRLRVGRAGFNLVAEGRSAWAEDRQMDAAIVAALRSANSMQVRVRGYTDRYNLSGVATAMDAAVIGCSRRG
ncbi:hypothetical protein [Erythrobacter ani]|uniref:OmpA-like domain-containing protein n=1 Tax=Erythrobacter ani TaxID=2827235 RepID=A0ABS6SP26_9SPHN|nr:hypothetical protein [Erythrobacter ani]MBV7266779.1 hypothetical protein [Erythrobacter ani]